MISPTTNHDAALDHAIATADALHSLFANRRMLEQLAATVSTYLQPHCAAGESDTEVHRSLRACLTEVFAENAPVHVDDPARAFADAVDWVMTRAEQHVAAFNHKGA